MTEIALPEIEDTEPAGPKPLAGQNRIRLIAICFVGAFLAIAVQLGLLTLWPKLDDDAGKLAREAPLPRPDIIDRNGVLLATDIAVASLYADPRKIIDIDEAVELLTATLPDLDARTLRQKLSQPNRAFAWLKRQVTPEERDAVYNLGIPGVGFVNERRRVYPQGRLVVACRRLCRSRHQGHRRHREISSMTRARSIRLRLPIRASTRPSPRRCRSTSGCRPRLIDELAQGDREVPRHRRRRHRDGHHHGRSRWPLPRCRTSIRTTRTRASARTR